MKALLTGWLTFILLAINTVCFVLPLMCVSLVKVVVPIAPFQQGCTGVLTWIAETWSMVNKAIFAMTTPTVWDIRGLENVDQHRSYLVLANHQSWVDIPALLQTFTRKIPFFKFFLKRELIWVPLLGMAWWALDYPFVRRYSKDFLKKNPHLKGKDMELTRQACDKFQKIPVSVMNFVEGTRCTEQKKLASQSPYQHLLKPKSGGVAFVLSAMGGQFSAILDVTLVYPEGDTPTFVDLMCGRVDRVIVDITEREIPAWLCEGDYGNDKQFRVQFQQWLNQTWQDKDKRIGELSSEL
ncbi:putative acyltransferase YihG [Sinobacterium norvegicum]|uniref:Acyltransferase YihG n=1 Tax=Sinobacterium norvegicum TaxID=1641715 RepID=A0ABM9ACL3_9GAMM|nr:acyltransferase [Sinobacterium norvegicum]CAH0990928.1 putative acyltransferase YihG [Sinobacterium norvegicum]